MRTTAVVEGAKFPYTSRAPSPIIVRWSIGNPHTAPPPPSVADCAAPTMPSPDACMLILPAAVPYAVYA
jgi:hypothetical protein